NHAAKTEIAQRPCRVFAARAAAKIFAGDENLRALVARIVEHKVRNGITGRSLPPIEKEKVPITRALDPLQELLGNNLVRVDIRPVERHRQRCECLEWLHTRQL